FMKIYSIKIKQKKYMKNPILLNGFTKYSQDEILDKSNYIIENMTGNALFNDAGVKLTTVVDARANYNIVLGKKGKVLNYRELEKEARKMLNNGLKDLGFYIIEKYPFNVANWLTSGYSVQTFDGATHTPAIPSNVKAKDAEHTGEALVVYDKSLFAEYYEGRNWKQGEPVPAGITATSKTQKMLFDEMTAGDKWNFQVRSRGTKGTSDWGQVVTMIVR
ncbi:MAG TPA: hypothetical protein VJY62_16765, partial [Bacteroidia bacterium]|nr:hypothetical protein [Bacteroidia bacterium]